MRALAAVLVAMALVSAAAAEKCSTEPTAAAAPAFTFDDIFDGKYSPRYLSGASWQPDDTLIRVEGGAISRYDPSTQASTVLVGAAAYAAANASSFRVAPDGSAVLLATASEAVYRHSTLSVYKVFDVASATLVEIDPGNRQQTATWGANAGTTQGSPAVDSLSNSLLFTLKYRWFAVRGLRAGPQHMAQQRAVQC